MSVEVHPDVMREVERLAYAGRRTCYLCAAVTLKTMVAHARESSPVLRYCGDAAVHAELRAAGYIVITCSADERSSVAILQCKRCRRRLPKPKAEERQGTITDEHFK